MKKFQQKIQGTIYHQTPYLFALMLLGLIIWLILLYADLSTNRGLISIRTGIRIGKWSCLMLSVPALISCIPSKSRTLAITISMILISLTVFLFTEAVLAESIWNSWLDQTLVEGDRLIVALDHYYDDTGEYPATLVQLIPEYVTSLPRQQFGFRVQGFDYESTGESYLLFFSVAELSFCKHHSQITEVNWQCQ